MYNVEGEVQKGSRTTRKLFMAYQINSWLKMILCLIYST